MYNHYRKLGYAVLAALLLPAAASYAATSLIGRWQCRSADGNHVLVFTGSTLLFDGDASAYTLRGDMLLVQEEDSMATYHYELKGDQLAIKFPDGSLLHCSRAADTTRPAPARPGNP